MQYLLGHKFTIRTDHKALVWLFKLREPKGRIAPSRWIEILSQFNFTVEYRPGAKHQNADAMSRICNPRDCTCSNGEMQEILKCGPCPMCGKRTQEMDGPKEDTENDTKVNRVWIRSSKTKEPLTSLGTHRQQGLIQRQHGDDTLKEIIKWLKLDKRPEYKEVITCSPELRHYWHFWSS